MQEILVGGIAGGTAKTCVAPLERCKILYQTGKLHHAGILSTLTAIYRYEGIYGLFRGNGASILRIIPYSSIHFGLYEQYRRGIVEAVYNSSDPHLPGVSPFVDLLAGSSAGATAVLITYPLDLVRTRLAFATEAGELPGDADQKRSSRSGQQLRGNFKGSRFLHNRSDAIGSWTRGTYGNAISNFSRYPRSAVSTVFTRISLSGIVSREFHFGHPDPKHSIRGVVFSTLRNEGVRGLYHGIGPSLYGILPYAGLKFFVYQHLKQACLYQINKEKSVSQLTSASERMRLPVPLMLICGGMAGLIAQTLTYPLDVVRRRMQVEGLISRNRVNIGNASMNYKLPPSTFSALFMIWRTQGWRMLFNGLSINYMKVVPSTAIGFSLYDYFKHVLDLPTHL